MNNNAKSETEESPLLFAIKSSVEEAFLSSSIHGLNSMVRSNLTVLKIAWILLFIGSAGYCSYLVSISVQGYLEYEVVTNIFVESEIPAKFPTITICNENSIMTEYGLNFTKQVLDSMGLDIKNLTKFGTQYYDVLNTRIFINMMNLVRPDKDRNKTGLNLDQMLISCNFGASVCSSSDFVYKFSTWYGNCYQFNSGKYANGSTAPDLMVAKSGWYDGLVLELYVGNPTNPYSLSTSSGLHVYVNNKTLYDGMFDGFAAQPGTNNLIGVSRTFSENLPQPYSDCMSDEDIEKSDSFLVKAILSTGYKYRFSDCAMMCWVQYSIDKCQCQDASGITLFDNISVCLNDTEYVCDNLVYVDFFKQNVKKLCDKWCPVECSTIDYDIVMTSLSYPTRSYYEYLLSQSYFKNNNLTKMSYEEMRSSILAINVNYKDMSFTRIEKNPKMVLLDLIGSIGGTLGLFVGASFMSFFEIVDLLIVITYLTCQSLFMRIRLTRARKYRSESRLTRPQITLVFNQDQ